MLSLRSMLHMVQTNGDFDSMEYNLVADLFSGDNGEESRP